MSENNESTSDKDAVFEDLVVIGSSAGGIDALLSLIGSLPSNFPVPLVIAQHLDPTRPSQLATILQRRTSLPVVIVEDRHKLDGGSIYVIPSNRYVSIDDHEVRVFDDNSGRRPKPSIDLLLSTAAEAYGDRLIAVILSGAGSDGASGAVEVKNSGGTVIIQSPGTARYPSMPRSLSPASVDFESDVERIGPLLNSLVRGDVIEEEPVSGTEDILQGILEQVSRRSNIDFRQYKVSTILRRIGRRMTVTHHRTMSDYRLYLETHPEEIGELVKAFLINVTQFFRDGEAFTYLKNEILPGMLAQARAQDRILRFWSAGCATGEEPYSLAMLLVDLLGAELPEWGVKIFATDLDEAAVSFARRGFYYENNLKGLSSEYRERFFEQIDGGFRISKTLRQMVIFGQQDLSHSAPFPRINLVLCRNVLIYFTAELQDYVLNQFAFSLAPDGYLLLGKAETVRPNQAYFSLIDKQWKIYRCINPNVAFSRRPMAFNLSLRPNNAENSAINRPGPGGKNNGESETPASSIVELNQLVRFNELLLRFLPVGVVVIDRNYRIITVNASARRLLGLRETGNDQDFLHSVRGLPYSQIRPAIDEAFRERSTVSLPEIELESSLGGNGRYLSISIVLMQGESTLSELAAISLYDVSEQVLVRRQLETIQNEQAQLMNELSTSNRRLNDTNKELVDANEELQVANEELVLTHEELQATIEEFETTNEELQATNEELETNNEELQATNEELQTTNDELRARTQELQDMTTTLDRERNRLSQVVDLGPFFIIVLSGPDLLIEALHPRYIANPPGRRVQGQPLEVMSEMFGEATEELLRLAREVYTQNISKTSARLQSNFPGLPKNSAPKYSTYSLVPLHGLNGVVEGVAIYVVDDELLKKA